MSGMSMLDALNFLNTEQNSISDAGGMLLMSDAGMREATRTGDAESYALHRETYDYQMGRVEAARVEQETEQQTMDIEAAKLTCDCKPGEPCCLDGGKVWDSAKPGRLVTWPIINGQSRLYVIARDVEDAYLVGKVKSEVNAIKDCTAAAPVPRGIATNNAIDSSMLPISATERNVPGPRRANFQSLGQGLLPGDFVIAMTAVDTLISAMGSFSEAGTVTYKPEMCQPENGMGSTLQVQAVQQIELGGEAKAYIKVGVHTSGFSVSTGVDGKIEGKVGDREIKVEGEAKAEEAPPRGRSISPPAPADGEGMSGFIADILGQLSQFASKGDPKGPALTAESTTDDLVDAVTGSGVEFLVEFKLGAEALKLTEVDDQPDLKLDMTKLEGTLTLAVTGTIDLIELAVALILSPPAARTVQSARAAAAQGDVVRGEAKCDVTLKAEGTLTQKYETGFSYLYSANADSGFQRGESGGEFGGKVTVTGEAEISIHAEARVWVAKAQAGARGAIHTAWVWEMRKPATQRQKRFYFEGLRARATAYAEIGISNDDSDPIGTIEPTGRSNEPDNGVSTDVSAEATQTLERVGGPRTENWSVPSENEKVLLPPSFPEGTDPPWEDY